MTPSAVTAPADSLGRFLDCMVMVTFHTRTVAAVRDTGDGLRSDSRVEKVLQRVFDPKLLRPQLQLKQRAVRLLRASGVKVDLLDAWAVRDALVEDTLAELREIRAQWLRTTDELVPRVAAAVDVWAQAHPEHAVAIRRLAPTERDVREQTQFLVGAWRLRSADLRDGGDLSAALTRLPAQLLKELGQMLVDSSIHKSASFKTRTVQDVLLRLGMKARLASFLHPVIEQTADVLESVVQSLGAVRQRTLPPPQAADVRRITRRLLDAPMLLREGWDLGAIRPPLQAISALALAERKRPGRRRKNLPVPTPLPWPPPMLPAAPGLLQSPQSPQSPATPVVRQVRSPRPEHFNPFAGGLL